MVPRDNPEMPRFLRRERTVSIQHQRIHSDIYMDMYTQSDTYVRTHVYVHMCVYVYTHIYICIYANMHVLVLYTFLLLGSTEFRTVFKYAGPYNIRESNWITLRDYRRQEWKKIGGALCGTLRYKRRQMSTCWVDHVVSYGSRNGTGAIPGVYYNVL